MRIQTHRWRLRENRTSQGITCFPQQEKSYTEIASTATPSETISVDTSTGSQRRRNVAGDQDVQDFQASLMQRRSGCPSYSCHLPPDPPSSSPAALCPLLQPKASLTLPPFSAFHSSPRLSRTSLPAPLHTLSWLRHHPTNRSPNRPATRTARPTSAAAASPPVSQTPEEAFPSPPPSVVAAATAIRAASSNADESYVMLLPLLVVAVVVVPRCRCGCFCGGSYIASTLIPPVAGLTRPNSSAHRCFPRPVRFRYLGTVDAFSSRGHMFMHVFLDAS